MDKQDDLAAFLIPLVDSIEFRTAVGSCRTQFGKPEDLIAAAVGSYMGSRTDEVRLAIQPHLYRADCSNTGEHVARAALSAALGTDIGGGRAR